MSEPETTPTDQATSAPTTVDAYVQGFPDGPRQVLEQVAAALRRAVPGGEEKIRYGIHFAGWKKHVGLYPVGELDPDLEAEVAPHRAKKDTVQFFYKDPVPYDLIERVARALAARHSG